uniref:Uncharacterized protein n=1 Tax=Anguilla anguilla TaxID=7936 RepID=A0A0E9T5J2_ANGAN
MPTCCKKLHKSFQSHVKKNKGRTAEKSLVS